MSIYKNSVFGLASTTNIWKSAGSQDQQPKTILTNHNHHKIRVPLLQITKSQNRKIPKSDISHHTSAIQILVTFAADGDLQGIFF
jgi:hypothetical protein